MTYNESQLTNHNVTIHFPPFHKMNIVHLAASPFLGGPESQMLGLIEHLPTSDRSTLLSFSERGRCRTLLDAAKALGAEVVELEQNAPHYRASAREIAEQLNRTDADVLLCHGYKPDILGVLAARKAGVPVVSVSHGWTAATFKVRVNETIDRLCLQGMDRVVCVSERQAKRVRRAGVPSRRIVVIHNAIDVSKYGTRDATIREQLLSLFSPSHRPRLLVGAAGRLSPEKGYGVLVAAAAEVLRDAPDVGFIHFGDGPLRAEMIAQIAAYGLQDRFVLAGFRADITKVYSALDVFALPSFTEGLPVVVLEAFAASVPVVATAVGGTPEVVSNGENGFLVPPRDARALARAIVACIAADRKTMGEQGRAMVLERFTFTTQAERYRAMFAGLRGSNPVSIALR